MKINLKQQLIYMMLDGKFVYRYQWFYIRKIYEYDLVDKELTLKQAQEIYDEVANAISKPDKRHSVNFSTFPTYQEEVDNLAQQALIYTDNIYPKPWKELAKPPLVVFYQGDLSILHKPLISIIGTRKLTDYARRQTELIAKSLSDVGFVIVSGLAAGVDAAAHRAAIKTNKKSTIAVLANGTKYVYPKAHSKLQQVIKEDNLLLSEYLPNQRPQKHQFVMRNRLVAGLSPATILIEAARKSGSLITANYAIEANRELFVLPGQIDNTQAIGGLELIYNGATPIISIEQLMIDVIELYNLQKP